jgi:hypothetical protein
MPFTLAHPAAVVPLRRLLPLSALVVGSMSPDFEYLFRLAAVSEFSHTLPGILYFCTPVGLVVLWLFHSVVKLPVLLLLPNFVRQRLEPFSSGFPFLPLSRLSVILLALAVGAFSHTAWDSFTHEYGWAVGRLPMLRANLFDVAGREVRLYKLLQHGSTLVGLWLIAYRFWRWLRSEAVVMVRVEPSLPDRVRHRILLALLLSTCIIGVSIGLWSASRSSGLRALQVFVVQSAVGGMAAFAVCVLLFSVLYRGRNHANKGMQPTRTEA